LAWWGKKALNVAICRIAWELPDTHMLFRTSGEVLILGSLRRRKEERGSTGERERTGEKRRDEERGMKIERERGAGQRVLL
jgi:hypothetical protein